MRVRATSQAEGIPDIFKHFPSFGYILLPNEIHLAHTQVSRKEHAGLTQTVGR